MLAAMPMLDAEHALHSCKRWRQNIKQPCLHL
jgi:hypothetical protein